MARTIPTVAIKHAGNGTDNVEGVLTAVLTNDAATSAEFATNGYRTGCLENHTGSAITITWWGSMTSQGTSHPLMTNAATPAAVVSTIGADHQIHQLPDAVLAVPYAVPASDAASGDSVVISLKS